MEHFKAERTPSPHDMNRQGLPLPSAPSMKKSYQMYGDRAHWLDATHTYIEKRCTYTGNDRQLQSSHKKIARQNRNVNKTNSSYVN